jgi:ATP-dependent Clp protease ATP-binding subunit ClpA
VIQQQIEDPLSDALLAREFSNGDQVLITLDDKNEIAFRKVEPQREEL